MKLAQGLTPGVSLAQRPASTAASGKLRAAAHDIAGLWGMEMIGSKSVARINANIWPGAFVAQQRRSGDAIDAAEWQAHENDPTANLPSEEETVAKANARLVDDRLAAIAENREPACGGFNGMKAVEMAVFAAGLRRRQIEPPLAGRSHPLSPAKT